MNLRGRWQGHGLLLEDGAELVSRNRHALAGTLEPFDALRSNMCVGAVVVVATGAAGPAGADACLRGNRVALGFSSEAAVGELALVGPAHGVFVNRVLCTCEHAEVCGRHCSEELVVAG